jgi:hypothetical protein
MRAALFKRNASIVHACPVNPGIIKLLYKAKFLPLSLRY